MYAQRNKKRKKMKHVMVRMKEDLFEDFDKLCKEKGYTKGGLI